MLQQVGVCSAETFNCSKHLLNAAIAFLERCQVVLVRELLIDVCPIEVYRAVQAGDGGSPDLC